MRTPQLLPSAMLFWVACATTDPASALPQVDDVEPEPSQAEPHAQAAPAKRSAADVAWLRPSVARHIAAIDAAAQRHDVDPRLVAIVIDVESRGQPHAVSPAGALGLMQVMPATAADIAHRHGLSVPTSTLLLEIDTNLEFGTRLLAELIEDFGDPSLDDDSVHRVATAYNGGSGVVVGRREASEETVRYAARVVTLWAAREEPQQP